MAQEIGLFEFAGKFGHYFFLILPAFTKEFFQIGTPTYFFFLRFVFGYI